MMWHREITEIITDQILGWSNANSMCDDIYEPPHECKSFVQEVGTLLTRNVTLYRTPVTPGFLKFPSPSIP